MLVSFYEVKFPPRAGLGLGLNSSQFTYRVGQSGARTAKCSAVMFSVLNQSIREGDILLSVNQIPLINIPGMSTNVDIKEIAISYLTKFAEEERLLCFLRVHEANGSCIELSKSQASLLFDINDISVTDASSGENVDNNYPLQPIKKLSDPIIKKEEKHSINQSPLVLSPIILTGRHQSQSQPVKITESKVGGVLIKRVSLKSPENFDDKENKALDVPRPARNVDIQVVKIVKNIAVAGDGVVAKQTKSSTVETIVFPESGIQVTSTSQQQSYVDNEVEKRIQQWTAAFKDEMRVLQEQSRQASLELQKISADLETLNQSATARLAAEHKLEAEAIRKQQEILVIKEAEEARVGVFSSVTTEKENEMIHMHLVSQLAGENELGGAEGGMMRMMAVDDVKLTEEFTTEKELLAAKLSQLNNLKNAEESRIHAVKVVERELELMSVNEGEKPRNLLTYKPTDNIDASNEGDDVDFSWDNNAIDSPSLLNSYKMVESGLIVNADTDTDTVATSNIMGRRLFTEEYPQDEDKSVEIDLLSTIKVQRESLKNEMKVELHRLENVKQNAEDSVRHLQEQIEAVS